MLHSHPRDCAGSIGEKEMTSDDPLKQTPACELDRDNRVKTRRLTNERMMLARSLRNSAATFLRYSTHTLPAMESFVQRHIGELYRAADELERSESNRSAL